MEEEITDPQQWDNSNKHQSEQNTNNIPTKTTNKRSANPFTPRQDGPQCNYCERMGHVEANCYHKEEAILNRIAGYPSRVIYWMSVK